MCGRVLLCVCVCGESVWMMCICLHVLVSTFACVGQAPGSPISVESKCVSCDF